MSIYISVVRGLQAGLQSDKLLLLYGYCPVADGKQSS